MERIYIENAISLATLRKIYKVMNVENKYWAESLDRHSDMNQYLENLDNGFITLECLQKIVFDLFRQDSKKSFRECLSYFGTRQKKRFIHDRLNDLLPENKRDIYYVK